jgi:hypothetical protein
MYISRSCAQKACRSATSSRVNSDSNKLARQHRAHLVDAWTPPDRRVAPTWSTRHAYLVDASAHLVDAPGRATGVPGRRTTPKGRRTKSTWLLGLLATVL